MIDLGAVVLCGGKSTRMGTPKPLLSLGKTTLLERVVERVARVVDHVVVVAAAGQPLPPLPERVRVAFDTAPDRGPLEGLAVGLMSLEKDVRLAFVTTTDAPFVASSVVRRLAALCDGTAAIPKLEGRTHPLTAVYATHLGAVARRLVEAGERRASTLGDRTMARLVARQEMLDDPLVAAEDPQLATFQNLNTPEDYEAARRALSG